MSINGGLPKQKIIVREHLIKQAHIQFGQRILDLGCGTGTRTILIKQNHPDTIVIGLNGDSEILEIARAKAAKAEVDITLALNKCKSRPVTNRFLAHFHSIAAVNLYDKKILPDIPRYWAFHFCLPQMGQGTSLPGLLLIT